MNLWQGIKTIQSSRFTIVPLGACFFATLMMFVGSIYSFTHDHDHDEHTEDSDIDCSVCAVFSPGTVKAVPDSAEEVLLNQIWIKIQQPHLIIFAISFEFAPNPARGPPVSVSF